MAVNNKFDPTIYMGNPNLPSSKAEFDFTPEMIKELRKCKKDISHFAENYFYITTLEEGKQKIALFRPQKRIIKSLGKFNRVVCLASRQTGKCVLGNTLMSIRNKKTLEIEELAIKEFHDRIKGYNDPCSESSQELFDFMHDEISKGKKFIESYYIDEYEVWTDTGWADIVSSNKTIPYDVWNISTNTHSLSCADNHIVFDENMEEVFVANLTTGQRIQTDKGLENVISTDNLGFKDFMYDLQLADDSNHRYYTNGILSHNTTLMTIYALWLTCFDKDKTVLIVANKEATAINILRRIRMAYEYLPNWLKPGVKQWGKTEVVFANDSRITISSTSSSSSRGETANCVDGESLVTIRDKNTMETMDISMKDLADILEKDGYILDVNIMEDE